MMRRSAHLAALCLLLLLPLLASGRGGGGQNYSSPSKSSSSSSGSRSSSSGSSGSRSSSSSSSSRSSSSSYSGGYSGGTSSSGSSGFSPLCCCVIVLIVGGVIAYALLTQKKRQKQEDAREGDARTRMSPEETARLVSALQAKDPQFDLAAFHQQVAATFAGLQSAWFKRELTAIRPYLSDATFQRFNTQLQLMAQQGVRNAITDLRILEVQLIGLDQSEWFDAAHVRIRASLRDTDVPADASDEQALAAAHKSDVQEFTEVWSFVRKPGVQTKAEGLAQGKCPNCGGPFSGGASNNCEYCGAIVNSGNYSWTLAEITQGIEYTRSDSAGQARGLEEARQTDPALNLQVFEDRASLIFWKWIEAQSRSEPGRLSKLATPEEVAQLTRKTEHLRQQGRRAVYLDCAVGAVRTEGFTRHPDGYDTADVEVLWSARMGTAPLEGPAPRFGTAPQRWRFVLRRKAGAVTAAAHGVSTFRCPNCNAALTDTVSASCDYCGTLLSTGDRDWVLAAANPLQ